MVCEALVELCQIGRVGDEALPGRSCPERSLLLPRRSRRDLKLGHCGYAWQLFFDDGLGYLVLPQPAARIVKA
jgi:hypothetical protein